MAWIESHQTLSKHKKTLRAVGTLQVDRHKFIGHMHQLWWWAVDNLSKDGELGDLSNAEIAMAAEWDGDADRFVKVLTESGFIDQEGPDRCLHEWCEYAGRLLEKREKNAERMRSARAANVQNTCDARAGATVPYRTVPNQTNETMNTPPNPRKRGQRTEFEIDFETLWASYPRKTNKAGSLAKYAATRRKGAAAEELLIAVRHYALSRQGEDQSYTMHGATFFGPQERWRDFLNPPGGSEIGKSSIRRGNGYADHTADGPKWLPNSGFRMANRTGRRSVGENA